MKKIFKKLFAPRVRKSNRPICPECYERTIVLFTPPKSKPPKGSKPGDASYIDWGKAHLYCCNGESNCTYSPRLGDKELCT